MKSLKLILLILFSSFFISVNAQNISGTIEHASNISLYLFSYYGNEQKLIDSSITDDKGNFNFK
ncbi:MAG TPA: hypothetical protein PK701_06750, partial [Bacteroidales bacterium]|nr:hypothetical protein [Bacteroidales bacterium]